MKTVKNRSSPFKILDLEDVVFKCLKIFESSAKQTSVPLKQFDMVKTYTAKK